MYEPALLERAAAGDEAAFDELMRAYLPRVYRFCLRFTGSEAYAEDATQDAFVKAWRSIAKADPARPFGPWLFAIARNAATDVLRRQRAVPMSQLRSDEPDAGGIEDTLADPEPLPDALFARAELGALVQRALADRPPRERALLSLRYEDGCSFEEIGEVLGMPSSSVRSIHRRALTALRAALAQLADATEGIY